jgi:hypothetical protein
VATVPLEKKLNTKEQENEKKEKPKEEAERKRRDAWGDADFSGG